MNFNKTVPGPLPYCNYPGSQYLNVKAIGDYDECAGCNDEGASCPLGLVHPPNGVEFCMGCSQCSVDRERTARIVVQIKALAQSLSSGYLARLHGDTDWQGAQLELNAAMMVHGLGALASGAITVADAIEWLGDHNSCLSADTGLAAGAVSRLH